MRKPGNSVSKKEFERLKEPSVEEDSFISLVLCAQSHHSLDWAEKPTLRERVLLAIGAFAFSTRFSYAHHNCSHAIS